MNASSLLERSRNRTLTCVNGSRTFTKRRFDRLAPLAMPVSLPRSRVRNVTILSDSPKARARTTIAGVTVSRGGTEEGTCSCSDRRRAPQRETSTLTPTYRVLSFPRLVVRQRNSQQQRTSDHDG